VIDYPHLPGANTVIDPDGRHLLPGTEVWALQDTLTGWKFNCGKSASISMRITGSSPTNSRRTCDFKPKDAGKCREHEIWSPPCIIFLDAASSVRTIALVTRPSGDG